MKKFFLGIFLGISLSAYHLVYASLTAEQELKQLEVVQEKMDLQKQWVKYRYDSSVQVCYQLFFVDRCLTKARDIYLKESKAIRIPELEMHDRQRVLNESIKTERDKLRVAEREDPKNVQKRAENRAAFDEKQRLKAEREAELEERRKDADARASENKNTSPF